MAQYVPQATLQYVTFIKRGIVEALQAAFNNHPDVTVSKAKVAVDFTHSRFSLPADIVKYYERELVNAGVGHAEWGIHPQDPNPDAPSMFVKYHHRLYRGDVAFEIYGQSSTDCALLRDALIEVLAMQEVTPAGDDFLNRFYYAITRTPYGMWHFPVLNLDKITGYGEQATIAPWMAEDVLVYQASYRVPIFGEFYSNTPKLAFSTGLVTEVDVYPYTSFDPTPDENPDTPNALGWYHFTKTPIAGGESLYSGLSFVGALQAIGGDGAILYGGISVATQFDRTGRTNNDQILAALGMTGSLQMVKSGP